MVTVALLLIETELARALMLAPAIHNLPHQSSMRPSDLPLSKGG